MDTPTRHFQTLIRRISLLARRFDGSSESVNVIHSVVANFDSTVLQHFLPSRFTRVVNTMSFKDTSGIQYADIYKDDYCHVNTFGLVKTGLKIPLHDHPNQHAVMKVFQGSVKIRSFSIIEDHHHPHQNGSSHVENDNDDVVSDEIDDDDDEDIESMNPIRVRYEGEVILSSRSGEQHSAVLGPTKGNIHEVTSLEPHTYFCDFFVPNIPKCHYYQPQQQREQMIDGQIVLLKRIRCPRDFYCDKMEFPSFPTFDFSDCS